MKRTRLLATLIALVSLIVAVLIARSLGLVGAAPIRIGAVLPLTGPDAKVGTGMRNSMRLAIDQVNERGGIKGRRVELVALDEDSDGNMAKAAARRLGSDPTVLASSSHYREESALDTSDIYVSAGLLNLFPGALEWEFTEFPKVADFFRVIPSDRELMRQSARYAWEIAGARAFYIIRDDSYFGNRISVFFKDGLTQYHGKTPDEMQLKPGDHDFAGVIQMMKVAGTDYVVFSGELPVAAAFLSQARAAGLNARFQIVTMYPPDELVELAGSRAAEGAIAAFAGLPPEYSTGGKQFLQAYSAAGFKEPAGPYGFFAYVGMQAILGAAGHSALTRASITTALRKSKHQTALGAFRFSEVGESTYHGVTIYQVTGGRWKPIYQADEAEQLKPVATVP